MSYLPTVVFDFDGVIHSYTSGWKGETVIPDPPVPGIAKAIADIRGSGYSVAVVSTRCATEEGRKAVELWLTMNRIVVDTVTKEKPPAVCYIDDRAICFNGHPESLLGQIQNFKPWYLEDGRTVADTSKKIQQAVSRVLRQIGVNSKRNGFLYLRDAITYAITKCEDGKFSMKEICWEVAKKHGVKTINVEANMRRAIERAWKVGDYDVQNEIFAGQIEADRGKPVLSQFIAVVKEYVQDQMN